MPYVKYTIVIIGRVDAKLLSGTETLTGLIRDVSNKDALRESYTQEVIAEEELSTAAREFFFCYEDEDIYLSDEELVQGLRSAMEEEGQMDIRSYIHEKLLRSGYRTDEYSLLDNPSFALYQGKKLHLRFRVEKGLNKEHLDIAYAPTFDRWANSVNFYVPFWPKNIPRVLWEARRIVRDNTTGVYKDRFSIETGDPILDSMLMCVWFDEPIDLSYIAVSFTKEERDD